MHDAMRNGVNLPQPPVLQAGLQHRQRSSVGVCGILRQGHLLRLALGIVVLGGGLVEAMPALYRREVEARAREVSMAAFRHQFKLRVAKLGDDAASLGAAAWARRVVVEHGRR